MQIERIPPLAGIRRKLGMGLALLILLQSGGALAQADGPALNEPITPVPPPPAADPLKVALGRTLFEDPRLSHDGTRSCASCHDMRTNGADAAQRDMGADGTRLALNTNTVFNATLSFRIGWAGQFKTLEDQAANSLVDPTFMATTIEEVLGKLKSDPVVTREFTAAYHQAPDKANLLDAIATYERSLVTPASPFDRWLEGDQDALSPQEQHGYALFKSLGCISCHQGVNVGGNLFERHGIFHPLASPEPEILRVPSLRNIATSPPYFHDGSAPTLGDAVRRMGFAQLNETLTDEQIQDVVSFLDTLTGSYKGVPVTSAAPTQ
jgi:cytochrome c peroxidase